MSPPQVISRAECHALGLPRYYTGKPCIRGHLSERKAQGNCIECDKTPEYINTRRVYRAKPEIRTAIYARVDKTYMSVYQRTKEFKEKGRAKLMTREGKRYKSATRHHIPIDEVPLPPLDERCDCCLRVVGLRRLHLDHCHTTGKFRAWNCNGCNTGVGIIDDAGRLQNRVDQLLGKLPWQ